MPRRKRPVLGIDYIMDEDGHAQFTREYLLKRGNCCERDCRYCPFVRSSPASGGCDSTTDSATTALVLATVATCR
jgi:hypothetical protein